MKFLLCTTFVGTIISMRKSPGRPKKDPLSTKRDYLEIRLDPAEKQAFRDASVAAGLGLSAWVRERLRQCARKELEQLGRPIAFLDRTYRAGSSTNGGNL